MKKLFTIILVLAVFASFGQRTNIQADRVLSVPTIGLEKDAQLDTILPGNWASATDATIYNWSDEGVSLGYIFGTNTYGDAAYAQRFDVTEPYEIVKAIFWIGAKAGTTGDVVFTIWDYSGEAPGDVLGSVTVSMADITAAENFEDALVVEFDEPIMVTGNYLMGADISGLGSWVDGTYGLGNVSSTEDNGTDLGYAYVLEGTTWVPVLNYEVDVDIAIFPLVQVPGETYAVTFNVDMGGATGFDPDAHEVWLTGNFTGWAEPGTEGSVQLFPAPPAKEDEAETFYFEGFEDWSTTEPGVLPEGWIQKRTTSLTDEPTTDATTPYWVANNPDSNPFGGGDNPDPDAWQTYVKTGEGSMITGYTTPDFTWAISPEITIPEASDINLTYWKWYQHNTGSGWFSNYHVMVMAEGAWENLESFVGSDGAPANLFASAIELSMDDYSGKTIKIAFVYEYTDGYQLAIDDITITGVGAGNGGEELIYTATADVPEGELLYKYFSNAFGEGWDGGEWAGDPNRSVMVEGDLVLNDVWADPTVSVNELQLDMVTRVYPNPVRNTLFIQSEQQIDHLRMFDLAGRLVYQTEVMGFETTIDANQLRGGLYILQMISGQQVKIHKIQVVK